ncbi:hypothetical protein TNCV_1071761 [Trichonephila clavipes]|nr:hypothetical protein TNCV_1071761 [Trichonephila clavipes]
MSRLGGQSEPIPQEFNSPSKLDAYLSTQCSRNKELVRRSKAFHQQHNFLILPSIDLFEIVHIIENPIILRDKRLKHFAATDDTDPEKEEGAQLPNIVVRNKSKMLKAQPRAIRGTGRKAPGFLAKLINQPCSTSGQDKQRRWK